MFQGAAMWRWMVLVCCVVECAFAVPFRLPTSVNGSKIWAVLATGSNGWENYCDQASVCRAYQIFKNHGVPDANIVVMMFDDIAYNGNNPEPGVIKNSPGGPNVYKGVVHDYTNMNVSHENFLNILRGDVNALKHIGSGKALLSGPDDYVIVYLAGHGGPGFVAFIDGELTAKDLMDSVQYMHSKRRYKRLVMFVEACNSGSMFYKELSSDIEVFATTAANPFEPSFASAWNSNLQTYQCLYYSCGWMANVEKVKTSEETLKQLYNYVKKEVNESHVQVYGDLSVGNDTLKYFFGSRVHLSVESEPKPQRYGAVIAEVARKDVPVAILTNKILSTDDEWTRESLEHDLQQELKLREDVRRTMQNIVEAVMGKADPEAVEAVLHHPASPTKFKCLKPVLSLFSAHCYNFSKVSYAVHVSGGLANMCEAGVPAERILQAIEKICKDAA